MMLWAIKNGAVSDHRYRKRKVTARGTKYGDPRCLIQGVFSTITFALSLTALLGPIAWAQDQPVNPAGIEFFEKKVRPLLVTHCYECHANGEDKGGFTVTSGADLLRGGDSGPAIVPGKAKQSRLIEALQYKNPDLQMPPDGMLKEGEIQVFEQWITMGAPAPNRSTTKTNAPTGMSLEDGKKFWSMQPLHRAEPPSVDNGSWVRTPIDAFVMSRLEQSGLQPAPPASKRMWLRRVTYNLIGLPPTIEETAAYLADDSPQTDERIIDRLLESPHYGERWGRHWLDVARYADSNGLDENLAFGNAWRYRDYVIESFNRDKPYQQFIVEQLAGDLLPHADRETKSATGFLALGAKVLAEPDEEKLRMDTIDEQIDATGKVFLGMTLGCARCHSHKFDPISQTDYYALAGIFKSTTTFAETKTGSIHHWYEHSFATDEQKERLKQVDAEIKEKQSAASKFKTEATAELRKRVHEQAAEYLAAAARFPPSASLRIVAAVAEPHQLHPRILHHCRLHLEYHRNDPVFVRWHELAQVQNIDGIRSHYDQLFRDAEAAFSTAKKADPKTTKLDDDRLEAARLARADASGFLAIPPKPEFAFDPATLEKYHRLMDNARILESAAPDETAVMGVTDGKILTDIPIHIRGSHRNLGTPVDRGFPLVMCSAAPAPAMPNSQSGRLELARWIASAEHPLTARVYVNRVWRWHFGRGIVATTENFGRLGQPPTHPQLLEWLSQYFIDSGWSTKALHRLILSSNVYRMDSVTPRAVADRTPDRSNQLLSRFHRQRLDAEQIRDAVLALSGQLDLSIGGKTIPLRNRQFVFNHTSVDHTKYDSLRRAIYLPIVRNNLYTFFSQFDFPDPTMPTGNRATTTIAPQALIMLNSDLISNAAKGWAQRLLDQESDVDSRIDLAHQMAYSRPATAVEMKRIVSFLNEIRGSDGSSNREDFGELAAWSMVCQSLFASNEFIYLR